MGRPRLAAVVRRGRRNPDPGRAPPASSPPSRAGADCGAGASGVAGRARAAGPPRQPPAARARAARSSAPARRARRRRRDHRRRHARHRSAARPPLRLVPLAGLPANLPRCLPWRRRCGSAWSRRRSVSSRLRSFPARSPASHGRGGGTGRSPDPVGYLAALAERFADMPGGRAVAPAPIRRRRRGRLRPARPGRPRPPWGPSRVGDRLPEWAFAWRGLPRSRRRPLAAALMAAALLAARRCSAGRARPPAHGPVPRRRPGRRRADPAPRRHRGPLRRRPARGRGGTPPAPGRRPSARPGRGHPSLARPPRRPRGGSAPLSRRPPPRRRRRHRATRPSTPSSGWPTSGASSESRRSLRWPSRSPAAACASVCCRRLRGRRVRRPTTPTRAPSSRSSARAAST